MQNLELKCRCREPELFIRRAEELPPHRRECLRQKDIYYTVPSGRLKLRLINGKQAQFIHYHRPDQTENKISRYDLLDLVPADKAEGFLDGFLTRWQVVEKTRQVWLFQNARIHLDEVDGAGWFAEFEVMAGSREVTENDRNLFNFLKSHFSIDPVDEIAGSYSDLAGGADSPVQEQL
ncbi:MAG: class IV adenylate cyclase [Bacteroidetes bacterium]|nr:class IV adenylate cyclase [Bacteroidota bacterium]